jgi:hypothetical protein
MFLHRFARFRAELRTSRFGLGSAGDAEELVLDTRPLRQT